MVAEKIIASLDKGVVPWQKSWAKVEDRAFSHATLRPYSLLNQFILDQPGEFLTFNQAKKEGGSVKKGAKSKPVVFWSFVELKKKTDDLDDETEADPISAKPRRRSIPILKYYRVFHLSDCEGITPKLTEESLPCGASKHIDAEKLIRAYQEREGLKIVRDEKSNRAFYSLTKDAIKVPLIEQFENTSEYYSTLFHELIHSTGKSGRLNRFDDLSGQATFGSETYSREELIAEIGSAALVSLMGLETPEQFGNSAAYVKGWRDRIAEDNSLIVTAAGRAEKAVQYILGSLDGTDAIDDPDNE